MSFDPELRTNSGAFIAVDVQNDFCLGGALAVNEGDTVVPIINTLAPHFDLAVATQDWHPAGHASFASSQSDAKPFESVTYKGVTTTLWPDHCVQGSKGADFHPALDLRPYRLILRKGFRPGLDSYSAFFENDRMTPTGLDGYLRGLEVKRVVIAGLALDFCVFYSAMDAISLGYRVSVVREATRAVGGAQGAAEAEVALLTAGVRLITQSEAIA